MKFSGEHIWSGKAPRVLIISVAASLLLGGCAKRTGPFGFGALVGRSELSTAEPLFETGEDKCFQNTTFMVWLHSRNELPKVLVEVKEGKSTRFYERVAATKEDLGISAQCRKLGESLRALWPKEASDQTARNLVMDSLIAASNRKCGRYTAFLKSYDGNMNSGLSIASIITGGLGGFVGGVNTAKALSGTSAIIGGSRSALNEVYFSNQTIHVLAAAYDKLRRDRRKYIRGRQQCTPAQYNMAAGLEDIFNYHTGCSIVEGLAETARAIERSENPGMDAMRKQVQELASYRRQLVELAGDGPITRIDDRAAEISLAGVKIAQDRAEGSATDVTAKAKLHDAAKAAAATAAEQLGATKPDGTLTKPAEDARLAEVKALTALSAAKELHSKNVAALALAAQRFASGSMPVNLEPEGRPVCPFD